MRLLIAMMKHETNTFSPVPTLLARFRPLQGEAAIRAFRGTGTGLGAYLDLAERERAEIVLPIAAGAPPSSPVEDAAYAHITDTICEAVTRGGFDGIMLDLHGAMVTQSLEDGEGEFLRRLRAIRTEVKPVMAWGNEPMLPHVMRQGTDDHPNKELQQRCAAMSAEGALAASLFTGFPHADITNAGLSAVVVTDGDLKLAEDLRDELLGRAWVEREAFVYKIEPLKQSVARAKAMPPGQSGDGPIVLLDHYDNCASGGTMDTTVVLAEIMRQGLEDVAAFAIYDPEAVQQAIAAGIGSEVTLSIGGKMKMPAIPAESPPLTVSGTVKTISNGRYRNRGPMGRGVQTDMGPSVVFDTGAVEIVLISHHVEPSDLNCFLSLGIDPLQKRYVMLKSRIHWRAGLGPMAKAVVECAGVGVCTSDYSQLQFKKVRRPIYPLDLPNR